MGYNSLRSNTTGSVNTAIGYEALYSNTTGTQNVALGNEALSSNIGGYSNTANGFSALYANTSGYLNVANGYYALHSNTSGHYNTANGDGAMSNNTTGSYNSANGATALFYNSTGSYNAASGFESLYSNNESYNTGFGSFALHNTTTSQGNTAIGYNAGAGHVNGYNNVFLGANTDVTGDDFYNCIAIGQGVVCNDVNQAIIGNSATVKWGFGVIPAAGRALQVGTNTGNGNGAYLSAGGTWTNASSIDFKDQFTALNKKEILTQISSLNISRWHYKGTDNEYHIGPIAEEFYKLFEVGTDEKHLSTIDPSGVALAGIQQLIKENDELTQRMEQLQNESHLQQATIGTQNDELRKLKEQVDTLTKAVQTLSSNK
jgi:endosialidase-like protein